ncbi:MAG: NAD+ synthase [Nitrosomonas sp.]|nr:NAD+ synthase [Nitrosomonas sp.]MDP1951764.1 NAD+ synthase [Nitrosomonas sp.]
MRIAIAQINCTVGDLNGNAARILEATKQAKKQGADLVITPELALTGYPPEDLLLRTEFHLACKITLANLIKEIKDITLLIGHPHYEDGQLFNAASVIRDGKVITTYYKNTLIRSPFFDEQSYFDAGTAPGEFELAGVSFGINICGDFWQGDLVDRVSDSNADILLVLNASAFLIDKLATRHLTTYQRIIDMGIAVVHANLVGGQDELVFDGASFVMNAKGKLTHQFAAFTETLGLVEIQNKIPISGELAPAQPSIASIYQALCLGVKDYIFKNDFPGVLLGLSGGVDSALALIIAVDALGAGKVRTVMMPSPYTADISLHDAQAMAEVLGVKHDECNIAPLFEQYLKTLADKFQIMADSEDFTTTTENLQARIRGTLLMALSNQTGAMVLATGNKSEMAVGYCTLYGDMAGGFAVLKDVSKTLVYQLCHYRNQLEKVIPERIIQRAPSAELRPNQTDQDSLPPYDILDGIMKAYMEDNLSPAEIIALNYDQADVYRVIHLIRINEHKRHQSPPGIRITHCNFGKAWRYPITTKFTDPYD